MKDVSIIIVNWNTEKLLRDCLKSVYAETKKYSYEVIVVDNNSPDNSAEMVRKEFPEAVLIANEDNKGFAPANNQGIEIATGKNIFLLNPDTVVLNGAIDKMMDFLYEPGHEPKGIITCKLLNGDGSLQKSVNSFFTLMRSYFENRFFENILAKINKKNTKYLSLWDHSDFREIDWAFGAVMLISEAAYKKVGLLDERFYIYAEEMDYYMRTKQAGFKSYFLPDVEITHYGKSSSRQRRAAMFIQNYKSFYIFLKKHYKPYVYYFYRLRAYLYMPVWIVLHSVKAVLKKITGKDSSEDIDQIKVYLQTFAWHFKSDSFIKL